MYFDYVQRSCSSLYSLLRFTNCPTYIALHYNTLGDWSYMMMQQFQDGERPVVDWDIGIKFVRWLRSIVEVGSMLKIATGNKFKI